MQEPALKRRDFLSQSTMMSLFALLGHQAAWAKLSSNSKMTNNHQNFLDFLNKSKTKFSFITMAGSDPTSDFIHNKQNGDVGATNPSVTFFNDDFESYSLPIPIFPHSIEQNPTHRNHIMLIPRQWPVCVELDVVENKIINEIKLSDKKFYGHGCYIPESDLFYATTFAHSPKDASLVLFNLKSQKIIQELAIDGGAGAHQCSLSLDKKHVIVTLSRGNKNLGPSIIWIDIKTGKIVDRIFNVRKHAEHFAELSDGYLIFTGGTPDQNVQTVLGSISPEKKVNNFVIDKELLAHFGGLSVSIFGLPEKNYSFMTNAVEHSVYVMDYKSGKVIKRVEVPNPRGINLSNDRKFLFVTSFASAENKESKIFAIDTEKLIIAHSFFIKDALAFASHANTFYLS